MKTKRPWEFNQWLSLDAAAAILSALTQTPVSTLDLVQWAANGDFDISLNLPAGQSVQTVELVHSDHVPHYAWENLGPYKYVEDWLLFEHAVNSPFSDRVIMDLLPISLGLKSLELLAIKVMDTPNEQQFPHLPPLLKNAAATKRSSAERGYFVQVAEDEDFGKRQFMLLESDESGGLQKAIEPPADAFIVVTPRAIIEFEQKQGNQSDSGDSAGERVAKPLGTTERNTLLVIIAALCKELDIDPTERGAAKKIEVYTDKFGRHVSDDAIKKHLDKIPDLEELLRTKKG